MKRALIITSLLAVILVAGCAKKPVAVITNTGNIATGEATTGNVMVDTLNTGTVDMMVGADVKVAADQIASWKGEKVGGMHTGSIAILPESMLQVDSNGNLLGGKVVAAMNMITVSDITDSGMNANLVTHLKSADFFDVANNPTTTIHATSVSNTGVITADVTIRGITKPLTFPVTLTKDGDTYLLSAELVITNKDFGIGDSLLAKIALKDTFTISLDKVAFMR
jgi:hypothetical protein